MTPLQREKIDWQLRAVFRKAVNFPATDLAPQLTVGVTRSEPREATLVKAIAHAIAPYIKELRDEIGELRARVDELEEGGT